MEPTQSAAGHARANTSLIVAAVCGLLAVIAVCLTLVLLLRSPASPPAPTQLATNQSAADTAKFVERRERVAKVTRLSSAEVKRLEDFYETGTAQNWVKLPPKDRLVVCMFHECTIGSTESDLALCLASVYVDENTIKASSVLKDDFPYPIKEFLPEKSLSILAERRVDMLDRSPPADDEEKEQFDRARSLLKA